MSISSASDALPSDHASTTGGQALRSFAKSGISSCPVFDGKVYQGFVDCFDILRALLSLVDIRSLTEENREYKLRVAGLQLEHQPLRSLNISQDGALIYKADLQSTLHDVVLYGFLQPDSAGCLQVVHRVGVFDAEDDGSDDDMTAGEPDSLQGINISAIVSQSDVVAFLHKHVQQLGPLADASLAQLGLADKAVVCVPGEMSAIHAFASMAANKVSCVGVISHAHGGGLVGSLSSSDLAGLLPEHFVSLADPVLQYLTARASASRQQHQQQQQQAVGSAHAWGLKGAEGLKPPPLVSVTPHSSLRQLLALLAVHRLHRLHVLDERSRPVGIVTATDLLRLIVGPSELLEACGPDVDLETEVEALSPADPPDCGMGMDEGAELIEPRRGLMGVPSSQALLDAVV
ncbi:hypothetical protein OEZ85_007995 [Tetradesmus obliquus]|uniref:CBS domain-containing protein n=1 Tax=Tetradesmus obliquus TaxID=3088 RepID=A0ABY8TL87_TETOB|nr:hypothetical protein OEZ85_007995 [Tetradesmus obliquus]